MSIISLNKLDLFSECEAFHSRCLHQNLIRDMTFDRSCCEVCIELNITLQQKRGKANVIMAGGLELCVTSRSLQWGEISWFL